MKNTTGVRVKLHRFNTTKPAMLNAKKEKKLQRICMDASTIAWIIDSRRQTTVFCSVVEGQVVGKIGAGQMTALSPFLFSLYTSDFKHKLDSSCDGRNITSLTVSTKRC